MLLAAQTFEVISPSMAPLLVGAITLVVLLGILAFFLYSFTGVRNARFDIEGENLVIKAPLYGRSIPKASLKLAEAKVATLRETPELQPKLRTNGMSFAGIKLGRFRLKDGSTALMYVSSGGPCLVIPTSENYTLILEATQPSELLAALKG